MNVSWGVLLSGLLLMACGTVDEASSTQGTEPLGTQESALCTSASVDSVSIDGASIYSGELAGSGSWMVSGGANAVRLEYLVDGVLYVSEERSGNSGTWYFSASGFQCGSHNFEVKAYPMIVDSAGNRTTCWTYPNMDSRPVGEACPLPPPTWQYVNTENCYDMLGGPCSWHNFTPSCPSNPEGKLCTNRGAYCWRVVSSSYVEEYRCE
ncbi:Hypothetical protein AA314_00923 [Archangium gephyra]|uniref:Lipoprotein n=1 Tax=Archangium gephyra TaxID=48 RepID=A0AAC8TAW9_9BACT|nr:Hypothetical protein AA314_00923 [Archangium gephyra]